jgi:hypothetical protein
MRNNIEEHSEIMSLLGKKLGLMENIGHLQKEIEKINKKIAMIEKSKVFRVLKGDKK